MKKERVLLITPNLNGIKDGLNRIQPPLGLMLIANLVEKDGHIVKIHDTALEGWNTRREISSRGLIEIGQTDDEITNLIKDFNPTVVGISVLFSNLINSTHKIAKIVKKTNKDIITIIGGNHISNAVKDYQYNIVAKIPELQDTIPDLENDYIDFAIIGESDHGFAKIINNISEKKSIDNLPGVVKRISKKKFIINHPERINDISNLHAPARHLVNMEGYFNIGAFHSAKSKSNRVLSVMCSRGCPEKCTFCTTPQMWGTKVRWRGIDNIIDEIEDGVKNYQIGEIQFEDDTLTANKKRLIELCSRLEKFGLPWCTPNGVKVNYHLAGQNDMFKAMHNSGCYQITLACESGVQRVLDNIINKRLNVEQIKPAIENAKKAGMLVHTFWILGYPGETFEEINKTVEFAMECGADSFSFAILSPLPGTPIYREVLKNNLWWDLNTSIDDLLYRSSLIKVDGFQSASEFENFVTNVNLKANSLLKDKNPERFKLKYGSDVSEKNLVKQT
tara:strand:- start:127 stop:1641 length:1515 start_codon:yes stop_codon:yes gene_type:complete